MQDHLLAHEFFIVIGVRALDGAAMKLRFSRPVFGAEMSPGPAPTASLEAHATSGTFDIEEIPFLIHRKSFVSMNARHS